jgi:hypothetical protein
MSFPIPYPRAATSRGLGSHLGPMGLRLPWSYRLVGRPPGWPIQIEETKRRVIEGAEADLEAMKDRPARTVLRAACLSVALFMLAAGSPGVPAAGATTAPRAVARSSPPPGWRVVTFGRAQVLVPAAWPVFDTSADPSVCVRTDRHAVY